MSFQFSLAARYLWGRKLRSFLTTLAIVIGVMPSSSAWGPCCRR